jgi:hypothetical protein
METKEFVVPTYPTHQSTRRNYTSLNSAKLILVSITVTQLSGENINNQIEKKKNKYRFLFFYTLESSITSSANSHSSYNRQQYQLYSCII